MKKRTRIRIGIVAVITCVMCFSDWSFAAEGEGLKNFGIYLNYIVNILAWIWILFAKLAGTFLTNKRVYGEILGWDVLLWKFWNVMKNIANFGLGFYFVYEIFRGLISKEGVIKDLKKKILWLLVAGVGIQASWFLTAAIIDVSTITLAGVGSFPAQVISRSSNMKESMIENLSGYLAPSWDKKNLKVAQGQEVSVLPKNEQMNNFIETDWVKLKDPQDFSGFVDSLTPNPEDVSGPLYYLGFSILNTINSVPSLNLGTDKTVKQMIFTILFNGLTTVIFSIEMGVLCILALMRLVYLRMFIILSPLAVLLKCIEKSGQKIGGNGGDSFLSKLMKQIDLKPFLVNVFKPTIIVLGFGIAILFASLMSGVIKKSMGKPIDLGGTVLQSTNDPAPSNGKPVDQTYETSIDNNLFSFTLINAGKTFLEFILSIITVLIIYFIIKFAAQMGKGDDFVSKGIGKVQDSVSDILGQIPVVPVAGYDENGAPETRWLPAKSIYNTETGESELLNKKIYYSQMDVNEKIRKQEAIADKVFGDKDKAYLPALTQGNIETAISDAGTTGLGALTKVKTEIQGLSEDIRSKGVGMTLQGGKQMSDWWIAQFKTRLEKMKGKTVSSDVSDYQVWNDMIKRWNTEENKNQGLESLFKNNESKLSKSMEAYTKLFGLKKVDTWEKFIQLDISKK